MKKNLQEEQIPIKKQYGEITGEDPELESILFSYKKWRKVFGRVAGFLYLVISAVELCIFFILKTHNMITQELPEYIWSYLLLPMSLNAFIIILGNTCTRKSKNENIKNATPVLAITFMCGTTAMIHRVFLVTAVIYCIPIFISVLFRNKKLLGAVTLLSEIFILLTVCCREIEKHGTLTEDFFLPSSFIAGVIVFCCGLIARASIDILDAQSKKLLATAREARDAERRAEEANRTKSAFLSNMSHEIRTPINAVLGLDEMIIRESGEKEIREYALDIRSSGRALLGLINDILDFSKIESGKMEIIPVDYDLSSVVNDLVNMVAAKAYQKGLSLQIDVNPKIPHVLNGDEIRIKQAVLNILSNAVKYTDKGYVRMKVDFDRDEDPDYIGLSFSVEDTGRGIKQEDIGKLLAPFERIEEIRNRHIEGTGLGISITTQLLALMDSSLQIESEFGKGSIFSFRIRQLVKDQDPIGDYENTYRKAKSREPQYKESFTAPEAKILVVDDMAINLTVVKGLLKQTRVQVDTALSGRECLNLASRYRYHLIFVDHMMPDMDGIQTLQHLRTDSDSVNKETPIVALTANAVSGARELYMENGFSDYLTKPIDTAKLEKMIVRLLPEELVHHDTRIVEEPDKEPVETQQDEILKKLSEISQIDVTQGIQASGGADLYKMVVNEFAKTIDLKADTIQNLYQKDDVQNYTIQVHALKSSARLIGAMELSKLAGALEQAGKEGDREYIDAHTDNLLCMYRELRAPIGAIWAENEPKNKPPIGEEKLKEAVEVMVESLEVFDFDTAQSVMDQLQNYQMPDEFREKFEKMKILMSEVARDDMIDLLKA